jgi:3-oxoacyl-[acyl-carrier-protein] synthase II
MPKKTVIIGYDAVSALGIDLDGQWRRALNGESGIGLLTRFPLPDGFPVTLAGQAADIDHLPYDFLKAREQARWSSPVFKYAMLTVARALAMAGLDITRDLAPRVGITYSSAVGGLDSVIRADRQLVASNKLPHPFSNPNSCINMVGGKISIQTGATGPIMSTITACATGVTSIITGAMLIERSMADVMICGAVDFALVEPIVAGFSTMNACYSRAEGRDDGPAEEASRPFSVHRRGFVISEGAGAVILASEDFARAHGLKIAAEIAGWGMTSDAYHYVAPNPETVTRCMADSISSAGITPADIDAVNAHAASTKVGDQVEVNAMNTVFGDRMPPVTANKSMIGHAMGASSAIESIFAIKGMTDGVLTPTINYRPDPELSVDCVPHQARSLAQEHVLKNAFGFGGCNACIVFRKTG